MAFAPWLFPVVILVNRVVDATLVTDQSGTTAQRGAKCINAAENLRHLESGDAPTHALLQKKHQSDTLAWLQQLNVNEETKVGRGMDREKSEVSRGNGTSARKEKEGPDELAYEEHLNPLERQLNARLAELLGNSAPGLGQVSDRGRSSGGASQTQPEGDMSGIVALPIVLAERMGDVAERRLAAVARQLAKLACPAGVVAVDDISGLTKEKESNLNFARALRRCGALAADAVQWCLVFEDDAEFHPNIQAELKATLTAAGGDGVHILHLCPGGLWGRKWRYGRNEEPSFQLAPDDDFVTQVPAAHEAGRVLDGAPPDGLWLGSPTVFLIKPPLATGLAEHLEGTIEAVDVELFKLAQQNVGTHVVALQPPLCYENEHGLGSEFDNPPRGN